jgi:hypothetical protein
MSIRKLRPFLLSLAVVGLATGQPAYAGFSNGEIVTMGGDTVFQIVGDAGGFTAAHRAWQTQDALDNALVLAQDRSPGAVMVGRENGAVIVLLDGRRVATADANSAGQENLSVEALADKWAQSIKTFLSDEGRTSDYVATLIGRHQVKASVALLERTLYVPAGFTFPITLVTAITSETVKVGDKVEATVDRDVPLGRYVIAATSTLTGEIIQDRNSDFGIRFTSLRTPNGTVMPINAIVMDDSVVGAATPHRVSTFVIPAGEANGIPYVSCRVPSGIGVGTLSEGGRHLFVFRRDGGLIAVGRPLNLVFETVMPVAVVLPSRPI